MSLVNAKDLLNHAYQNKYALAGIGVQNIEMAQAVVEAASEARSPVILNLLANELDGATLLNLVPSLVYLAENSSVPVALHLDHITDKNLLKQAVALGCSSFLYETLTSDISESINELRSLKEAYSGFNLAQEVSAGHLSDQSEFSSELSSDKLTRPATVKFLAANLTPAALGIAIGTEHGLSSKNFKIDFARLNKIHAETQQPLVIHGGSGLTEDQCLRLLRKGVAKINFYSDLVLLIKEVRNSAKICSEAQLLIKEAVSNKVKDIFMLVGSGGRAAEVMEQSSSWVEMQLSLVARAEWSSAKLNQLEPYVEYFSSALPTLNRVGFFAQQNLLGCSSSGSQVQWTFNFWQDSASTGFFELDEFKILLQNLEEQAQSHAVLFNSEV